MPRQMLTAALLAEVAAYIEQFADQVDEACHRLVVRNGYHQQREQILGPPLGDIDAMPAEYLKLGRHIANRGYCRPKRSCRVNHWRRRIAAASGRLNPSQWCVMTRDSCERL
jgi:hypothetical protein